VEEPTQKGHELGNIVFGERRANAGVFVTG
jgi:hypothetical protein